LGDMLELGSYEEEGHGKVGMRALEVADVLVTVGKLGRIIGEVAVRWGMSPDNVHMLENNDEAIDLLERTVTGEDVILVKGSRAMKMEEIVNALSQES
jgi:UDP-N-acetylmuramoyl-tripeptide--D-alanyl-D-alanine ligase